MIDISARNYAFEDDAVRCDSMSAFERLLKRLFDVVGSVVSLIVFSPLCLAIYVAIKREDNGDPIFRQERVGYKGETFTLYKFRSMREDAEKDERPQLCQEDDERLTNIGRFIRAHHLDELPQLWNVLKGEMSFVGPRPERPYFVEQIKALAPDYEKLYQMRPGLFSEATLYNGYTDTMEKMLERLRMDLNYLYTRSLWLDFKIIFLTASSILLGKKF